MNNIYHIVNGDSTVHSLRESAIDGEVIVWREMLCEGKKETDVGSDAFWKSRYSFFEKEAGVTKLEYFDKTIKEIIKIEQIPNYSEVVLWFEFDLFCQVNLMALCSYLLKFYKKGMKYSLICVGRENNQSNLQYLSDYKPEAYQLLLKNKVNLSRNNFLFAEVCWQLYIENDKEKIVTYDFNKNPKFNYFQLAMDQHLKRFPGENGLNEIDSKIIEIIQQGGKTKNDIVKELLGWQREKTVYGFGDLQYFMALKKLNRYYTNLNDQLFLNEKGKALLL